MSESSPNLQAVLSTLGHSESEVGLELRDSGCMSYIVHAGRVVAALHGDAEQARARLAGKLIEHESRLRETPEAFGARDLNMVLHVPGSSPRVALARPSTRALALWENDLGIEGATVFYDLETLRFRVATRDRLGQPQWLQSRASVVFEADGAQPWPEFEPEKPREARAELGGLETGPLQTENATDGSGCLVRCTYRGVVLGASAGDREGALVTLAQKLAPHRATLDAWAEPEPSDQLLFVESASGPKRRLRLRSMQRERALLELDLGCDGAVVFIDEGTGTAAVVTRDAAGGPELYVLGDPIQGDDTGVAFLPRPGTTPTAEEEADRRRRKSERVRAILRCPFDHGPLVDSDAGLVNPRTGRVYPVCNGKPVFARESDYAASPLDQPESQNPYGPQVIELIERYCNGWVLDMGSGSPSRAFTNVCHLELFAYPEVDVVTDGGALPFADSTFDAVLSEAVLEHVRDPGAYLSELRRVLKPGGLVSLDAAFLQPFHGYPDHYFNMTRNGLRLVVEQSGLEVVRLEPGEHQLPFVTLGTVVDGYLRGTPDERARNALLDLSVRDLLTRIVHGGAFPLDGLTREAVDRLAAGFSCLARKPPEA